MAVTGAPGIRINEEAPVARPILSAGAGVAAFLGFTTRGPVQTPVRLSSFDQFKTIFGSAHTGENLEYALQGFFDNGGSVAYVVRLTAYDVNNLTLTGNVASHTFQTVGAADVLKVSAGYRGIDSPGEAGSTLQAKITLDSRASSALSADASPGQTSVTVSAVRGFTVGAQVKIDDNDSPAEVHKIESIQGNTIFLDGALVGDFATAQSATLVSLEYKLEVLNSTNEQLEVWPGLSLSADNQYYADVVVNDSLAGSNYVKVSVLSEGEPTGVNTAEALDAVMGTDETAGFTALMFTGSAATGQYGLRSLDGNTYIDLLCAPLGAKFETLSVQDLHKSMLDYAESRMDLFAILDPEPNQTPAQIKQYRETTLGSDSYWGALYYPRLKIQDSSRSNIRGASLTVPPSGHVAGLYSRVVGISGPNGGISAAPAGLGNFGRLNGVIGLETNITETNQSELNPIGVNCIRVLSDISGSQGIFVFGARTLSENPNFRYVNVRRMMTYVEQTIKLRTRFAIFKKNGPELWDSMTTVIESFLTSEWTDGNLAGDSVNEAFFVQINNNTTSVADIENGVVRGKIGISLFRPAEFIIFTFTQTQGSAGVEEV